MRDPQQPLELAAVVAALAHAEHHLVQQGAQVGQRRRARLRPAAARLRLGAAREDLLRDAPVHLQVGRLRARAVPREDGRRVHVLVVLEQVGAVERRVLDEHVRPLLAGELERGVPLVALGVGLDARVHVAPVDELGRVAALGEVLLVRLLHLGEI